MLACAAALPSSVRAASQNADFARAIGSASARTVTFAPASGHVGTTILVRARNLPAITPVRLGLGGVRSGFEELQQLMTSESGEIAASVAIPEWATPDRTHSFVIFDLYFRPLAISEAFYVTRSDGLVLRRGRVIESEASCGRLLGEDGEQYLLVGGAVLPAGEAVTIEGWVTSVPSCGSSPAIEVRRVERVSPRS